jgi:hypothetical protein
LRRFPRHRLADLGGEIGGMGIDRAISGVKEKIS